MSEYDVRAAPVVIADITGRLIRNPNYGGSKVGLNGWCYSKSLSNHTKPGFQTALNHSIGVEGVRNPILVWALPEGIFLTFGGSRVKGCVANGIDEIAAIINDYTGAFESYPLVDDNNIERYFKDPPRSYEFGRDGFDYHYNLERARRHDHDPAGFAWTDEDAPFIKQEFPWLSETTE